MAREKELFRDNLIRLDEAFPGKELLNKKEVCDFTGLSRWSIDRHFTFTKNFISKAKLASELS